jgi:hypothetical protein
VAVAVATNLVRDALHNEHLLFEAFQWLEDRLERELFALFIGPEVGWHRSVWGENEHEPLLLP